MANHNANLPSLGDTEERSQDANAGQRKSIDIISVEKEGEDGEDGVVGEVGGEGGG